jgi:hypothetical protein
MRTLQQLLATTMTAALLAGCTGEVDEPQPSQPSSVHPASDAFVRTCDSSVGGSLRRAWIADALVAGPVYFGHDLDTPRRS